MRNIKRVFLTILKEVVGFLFLALGGIYLLKKSTKNKKYLVVLNYHNFSKYNNYTIKRGNVLQTGYGNNFEKQIKFLDKHFKFSYPEDFFDANNKKEGINILITFDDGYKDNYDMALPVFKKYDVKSIFFIVTGVIGTDAWLKHDELRYLVNKKIKKESEVEGVLSKMNQGLPIADWVKKNNNLVLLPKHRLMMNWGEINELAKQGFKVAPHTHNHKILSFLDYNKQEDQIVTSITTINKQLNVEPKYFAYPNGVFNKDSISILIHNNIKYSFTTISGFNLINNAPHLLKRLGVNPSDSIGVVLLKLYLNKNK